MGANRGRRALICRVVLLYLPSRRRLQLLLVRAAGLELLDTEGAAGEASAAAPASPKAPAAGEASTSGGSADDKELLNKYIAGESGRAMRLAALGWLGRHRRLRPWRSSCRLRYRICCEPPIAECQGGMLGLCKRSGAYCWQGYR